MALFHEEAEVGQQQQQHQQQQHQQYHQEAPHDNEEHDNEHEHDNLPVLQRLLPHGVEGACVQGGSQSGKSSLAFDVCYKLAQAEPDRQTVFIHCQETSQVVAKMVRKVVRPRPLPTTHHDDPATAAAAPHGDTDHIDNNAGPSGTTAAWDFSVLENVFLKRFTTAQHLCWYFGSLHNQPDHLLPSVIVVDDLDRFRSSQGHDPVATTCQVLSVMHDVVEHIRKRTGRPCLLVVTMERVERGLMAPLTRQLGSVLRIVHCHGSAQNHHTRTSTGAGAGTGGNGIGGFDEDSNTNNTILRVQEDRDSVQLRRGKPYLAETRSCRYARGDVVRVLEED